MYKTTFSVKSYPIYYEIELVRGCNCDCAMCNSREYELDFLPLDNVDRILNAVQPYAKRLVFVGAGEPLLHPYFREILKMCMDMQIGISINTNAILLTENLCKTLTKMPDFELKISLDAATPQTYKKIRGVDAFDIVMRNAKSFSDFKNDSTKKTTLIFVYVVMRENLGEILDFIYSISSFSPDRAEFHPVRKLGNLGYKKRNNEDFVWDFETQRCESFREVYNQTIVQAQRLCQHKGITCEITVL